MKNLSKFIYSFSGLFGFYYLSYLLPGFLITNTVAIIIFVVYLLFGLNILKRNKFSDYSLILNFLLLIFSVLLIIFQEAGAMLMLLIAIIWIILLIFATIIALKEKFNKKNIKI
jgi:hypothetical protein